MADIILCAANRRACQASSIAHSRNLPGHHRHELCPLRPRHRSRLRDWRDVVHCRTCRAGARVGALPFYQFGGYVVERLMVCVFHAAFVSMTLWRLRRRFALGLAGAMALHWLGNFPILLMAWNVGGMGKTFWALAVQCWLLAYFVGAMALLFCFGFRRVTLTKPFYGRRHCPECGGNYDAPAFRSQLWPDPL